jgi:hypothetical protein
MTALAAPAPSEPDTASAGLPVIADNDEDTQLEAQTPATTPAPESGAPEAPAASDVAARASAARGALVARIRTSASLPPGLQSHLTELIAQAAVDDAGSVAVLASDVIAAIESALPQALGPHRLSATQPRHLSGEGYFFGRDGELSDREAEALAHGQLVRSGLLRGQKVRVAQD